MDFHEVTRVLQQIWEDKPQVIVLMAVGLVIFVFVVLDARRLKRRKRRPRDHRTTGPQDH